jgi:hypothetical protein
MALNPGSALDAYESLAPMGAGGLRELYEVTDLDHTVVIKAWPVHVASYPELPTRNNVG